MMKWIYAVVTALILSLGIALAVQSHRLNNIAEQRDIYKNNMNAALTECVVWKTKDSLSAAKNDVLTLRIGELEKYREDDLKRINSLKKRNESLEEIILENSETKVEIQTIIKDSIIYVQDTAKIIQKVDWSDDWAEFHAQIDDNNFTASLTNKDSLVVGTTTTYKRFLGFLWKTSKIKNQSVYVTSKNPHTVIQDVECININK